MDITPALPLLNADAEQIKRVLDNLLSNAIRHPPRGGEIRITAARREDYVSISVADTGHGIPPEHLTRLFHRFLYVPGAKPGPCNDSPEIRRAFWSTLTSAETSKRSLSRSSTTTKFDIR